MSSIHLQSGIPHGQAVATNNARPMNTPNACIPCRKVKMKCTPSDKPAVCIRCQRKQFDCFFENHRRGRKPGMKLRARTSTQDRPNDHQTTASPPLPGSNPSVLASDIPLTTSQENTSTQLGERNNLSHSPASQNGSKVDGLSPFCLLNKHAMAGDFSVQNVLEADTLGTTDDSDSNTRDKESENAFEKDSDNPVTMGLLTPPTAIQLFDSFLKYMAPYVIHFDPNIHTYQYVQRRSSFLLVAILSASAKIFNPDLHPKLRKHSEHLLAKAFMSGEKSIDIIKAILMLTYWKEPDDTRVWRLVGFACRMCVELRGRRMHNSISDAVAAGTPPLKLREIRNIERAWLTLFVYDRSISLQVGKPWMLHEDDLTRRVDTWCSHELAIPSGDSILAAFVQLRVLSSDLLNILEVEIAPNSQHEQGMLLHKFNTGLDEWKDKWDEVFEKGEELPVSSNRAWSFSAPDAFESNYYAVNVEPCHLFLYRFYGLHTRLYINSLQLQIMLVCGASAVKQALWLSYTSAMEMLQTIIDVLGPANLLYYAQDSIHVMTAYAAVFLIKILLTMPEALPQTAESTITDTLTKTSEVFGSQCASPTTGCAFQAKFLKNVVTQYWSSKAKMASEAAQNASHIIERDRETNLNSNGTTTTMGDQKPFQTPRPSYPLSSGLQDGGGVASPRPPISNFDSNIPGTPSVVIPFAGHVITQDYGNQPFWQQDVMDPTVWDGLLADPGLYTDQTWFEPFLS